MHRALPVAVIKLYAVGCGTAQECGVEQIGAARATRHRNAPAAAHRRKRSFGARRHIALGAGNHDPHGVEEMPPRIVAHLGIKGVETEPAYEADERRGGAGRRLQRVERFRVRHKGFSEVARQA